MKYSFQVSNQIKPFLTTTHAKTLAELRRRQEELSILIEDHGRQKDQIIEAEFRLGKLPLEIQDRVAEHFYHQQNLYKEIGKSLRKKSEEFKVESEKVRNFIAKLQSSEKQMLQLNKRIGQLQSHLLSDRENPTERESQAKILLQDIAAFQQEIAELRASEIQSGEIGDISPLAKTAESMHEKVKGAFLKIEI